MLSKYEWAAHAAATAAEEAYERIHGCHAHDCDAAIDETVKCDECAEYFCAAHLAEGVCAACTEREAIEFKAWRSMNGALTGEADVEYSTRIDAARVTLQFGAKSNKRFDAGKLPIEESPLFGGAAQSDLFGEAA